MTVSREVKTGVVAILILVLFVWGYNFLKDRSLYDTSRTFYAEYTNVQGLVPKSPITINGLRVGSVSKISFHPEKKGILVAHLNITDDIRFSLNSVAQIYSPDFISGKSLKINMALDGESFAVDGDTLTGEVDSGIMGMINEQIAPLQVKVESFVTNTDSVMQNINELLNDENQKNIEASLKNLNQVMFNFRKSSENLTELLKENGKIGIMVVDAGNTMSNLSSITDSIQAADLGATLSELQVSVSSLNNLLDSVSQGHGTVGKLLSDEELYVNMTNASKELEELLREIKEHPKRFVHLSVFGKKEKPYVPPDEQE